MLSCFLVGDQSLVFDVKNWVWSGRLYVGLRWAGDSVLKRLKWKLLWFLLPGSWWLLSYWRLQRKKVLGLRVLLILLLWFLRVSWWSWADQIFFSCRFQKNWWWFYCLFWPSAHRKLFEGPWAKFPAHSSAMIPCNFRCQNLSQDSYPQSYMFFRHLFGH